MKQLIIFGAGDMARIAAFYFLHDSEYEVVAFTVHESFIKSSEFEGLPLIPFEFVERKYPPQTFGMFVAVGFKRLNRVRADVYRAARTKGYRLVSYVSSKALYFGEVTCGDNCFILEGNVIQPFVKIGHNVVLWSGNHIGHDVIISDHCFLSSHIVLSGHVVVGESTFIGVNASVKQGVTIGPGSLIGAGAVVLKSTGPGAVHLVAGTPASGVSAEQIEALL